MSTLEQALILKTAPSGESFVSIHALSAERGLFHCLKRIAKSTKKPSPKPDLFDTAELQLEASKSGNGTLFVKDYRLHRSRGNIGSSYNSLLNACQYAGMLVRNGTHLPDTGALFTLAVRTCDAFDSGKAPQIVLLKGLYLLLQTEGFPIREDWLPRLDGISRELARELIQNPISETPTKESLEGCEALTEDLYRWLQRETDVMLP